MWRSGQRACPRSCGHRFDTERKMGGEGRNFISKRNTKIRRLRFMHQKNFILKPSLSYTQVVCLRIIRLLKQ